MALVQYWGKNHHPHRLSHSIGLPLLLFIQDVFCSGTDRRHDTIRTLIPIAGYLDYLLFDHKTWSPLNAGTPRIRQFPLHTRFETTVHDLYLELVASKNTLVTAAYPRPITTFQ